MPKDKKNEKLNRFLKIKFSERNANSESIGKVMRKSKLLGNLWISLKKPVLPSELTGLTPITRPLQSTSPELIMNLRQLGQSRDLNIFLYRQSLILTDSGNLSKTLTTLRAKPVTLFLPSTSLSWKPNGFTVPGIYS